MITVFQARLHGIFTKIKSNLNRKKLHKANQGSNFFGGSFSNKDNVRAQFRTKRQSQHLKRLLFFKNRLIHFYINSTGAVKLVKQNKLHFSSNQINKPVPDQSTVSHKSGLSLVASSSCYHKSDVDHTSSIVRRRVKGTKATFQISAKRCVFIAAVKLKTYL